MTQEEYLVLYLEERGVRVTSAGFLNHSPGQTSFSFYLQNRDKKTHITGVMCGLKEVTYEKYQ